MTEAGAGMQACAIVALVGAPNVGKSTLLNQLVGAKISIVTHKVQTTRSRVRGVTIEGGAQLVFVDTPGIFVQPRRRLEKAMVRAAWAGVDDSDLTLLLFDAARSRIDPDTLEIVERLRARGVRAVLALNKIDRIRREKLLSLAARFDSEGIFERIFMISARTGDGIADLRRYLAERAPKGPWLFPEDQLSDLPMRLLAAEIVREKLFLKLHDELPYALTVETDEWEEFEDGSVRIRQTIFVERESQKRIAVGHRGETIRKVREEAQAELREALERPVHLFLFVKVREHWSDDPERYRAWGLDFEV